MDESKNASIATQFLGKKWQLENSKMRWKRKTIRIAQMLDMG